MDSIQHNLRVGLGRVELDLCNKLDSGQKYHLNPTNPIHAHLNKIK